MIKNIVFDLGRVLVNFESREYLKEFGYDDKTVEKLNEIIFKSQEWLSCDSGTYENNTDIAEILIEKYPDYSEMIKKVLTKEWVKMLTLKEDTAEYLKELKSRGFKIYILSNLSKESYDYNSKYEFFKYTDGGVYSYEVKKIKPNPEIYTELLKKYNLIPEETIFIDDVKENIDAANKLKINGVIFENLDQVKKEVETLIK